MKYIDPTGYNGCGPIKCPDFGPSPWDKIKDFFNNIGDKIKNADTPESIGYTYDFASTNDMSGAIANLAGVVNNIFGIWSADLAQWANLKGGQGSIYSTGNSSTYGYSTGGSEVMYAQVGGGNEMNQSALLPNGVFNIKDVAEAEKYGVGIPVPYLVNQIGSGVIAYIKPEETSEAIPVQPGQMYIYRIDGVSTKLSGVYKIPDFGRAYINQNGEVVPIGIFMKLHTLINSDRGYKDINWLNKLHQNNIYGWDSLFNAIK